MHEVDEDEDETMGDQVKSYERETRSAMRSLRIDLVAILWQKVMMLGSDRPAHRLCRRLADKDPSTLY
jgi:hypothetical protein